MHTELTVKIKNSSQTYSQKFSLYDAVVLGKEDEKVQNIVKEALDHLKICADCVSEDLKIDVKAKQVIQ